MPLSQKGLEDLAIATELLKAQFDMAKHVMTETGLNHNDENVIATAQILATNYLYFSIRKSGKPF